MNALDKLGRLYRNRAGFEVWEIQNLAGGVESTDVASDDDAAWLADRVLAGFGRVEVRLRGEGPGWEQVVEKDEVYCDHMDSVCADCVEEWSIDHHVRRVWGAGADERISLGRA